ncbi:MAG: dicarboxylate/amino acid:cation symporter, partial [Brevibacterium sp.]|nr:dicarboxylate/amino acid:cation symporter [Brevibacterium sp.]
MPSTADPTATSTPPQSASRLGQILRNYRFPLLILTGVVIGAIIGLIFGEKATVIKPFGTLFINMMFTLVVPLVFFSISSAVAGMSSATRLGKILGSMLGIFAITGIIASIVMIAALWITKATEGVKVEMTQPEDVEEV